MANTSSANKRVRQAVRHRVHNMRLRARMRTYIKKVIKASIDNDKEKATAAYKEAVPLIDSSVNKNLIHKNKAARQKSRLNNLIRLIK